MQAYFKLLNIPHTSCGMYQASLTFNKRDCLSVLKPYGILTAESFYINLGDTINNQAIVDKVGLPCFVKPADGGSSFGVSKVKEGNELLVAIQKAQEHGTEVLIEAFMEGREFTNGVYLSENGIKVLPITEIITQNEFFDFEAKYLGESQEITPAAINLSLIHI